MARGTADVPARRLDFFFFSSLLAIQLTGDLGADLTDSSLCVNAFLWWTRFPRFPSLLLLLQYLSSCSALFLIAHKHA